MFNSLSYRYRFDLSIPDRWLPLIHLYDPDLPLFPIYYFHVLKNEYNSENRTADSDRGYGYVEKINSLENNTIQVNIITNHDLNSIANSSLKLKIENEVKERFGINNAVTQSDIKNTFNYNFYGPLPNRTINEIWERVVKNHYGDKLPFGKLWDEVLGFTRFVASWNTPGGRKSELIQTHYFATKFGVRIQSASHLPQIDFYLFPVIEELTDPPNPLNSFPNYSKLVMLAESFVDNYCNINNVNGLQISKFNNPYGGRFNTEKILNIIKSTNIQGNLKTHAIECFNTFDKGPQRTVIFLLMLDDLRKKRISPASLLPAQFGSIYDKLGGTYQSPKVISIYAQQSFGNEYAMPIDTWVETILKWPLCVYPIGRNRNKYSLIYSNANKLGKLERLLWITAQARKVHSSACNDALWCLKYSKSRKPRGANPLSCTICLNSLRAVCPAFKKIKNKRIAFNITGTTDFLIKTSANNNITPNQTFLSCEGHSIYGDIFDDFSPADNPNGFNYFPQNSSTILTVQDFIGIYQK